MESLFSAAGVKVKSRRGTNKQVEPREGTKLRDLWDLFQVNRGKTVEITFPNHGKTNTSRSRQLDDLRDYYGLDIRPVGRGQWRLAGAWVGNEYHDYLVK